MGKKESLLQELGADTIDVMRQIKKALDPYMLMNPGKIFSATRDEIPQDYFRATTPVAAVAAAAAASSSHLEEAGN